MLELDGKPGPLACLVGKPSGEALDEAKRLVIRYSRFEGLPPSEVRAEPLEGFEWQGAGEGG
jgi:hypothetical protein